jgi:hypothetical protein
MLSLWRTLLRRRSPEGGEKHRVLLAQGGGVGSAMFVRFTNGTRLEIPGAEYVFSRADGRVVFLDKDRNTLREFPWGDVVAHGRKKRRVA